MQTTHHPDALKISPFCHRVAIALLEAGAMYTAHGFDAHNKPTRFTQANPLTGKIHAISHGDPNVPLEEPAPLSPRITQALIILEFLADIFLSSTPLPLASNPITRARVRFLIEAVVRYLETPASRTNHGIPEGSEKLIRGLEKVRKLLLDTDVTNKREYAPGRNFTNADCAIVPLLASLGLSIKTGFGKSEHGTSKRLEEILASPKFDRLRRYKKALWEKESVKKVVDLERVEGVLKAVLARN